jgi:glycosyltransferase involved in cell wall biosynthesis
MINVRRRNPLARLTYAHPRLERIACISEAVAGHFRRRGFAAGRLTVIHKGVDPAWFTPAPLSRAALGIPDGAAVAVFTGAIRPIKGVPVVLEALRRIPAGHDLHLLLVGARRDPEVERLAAQPDLRPRVHFTGWRRDAASLAGGCDMIVMPTLGNVEGLGKSVLEAMAQGVPAVVSNGGGLIEIVVDGESGLTVPTANVEAWAQALTRLVQDAALRGRLAAGARRRIEEHFHVRRMAEAYLALLSPGAASGP